MLAPSRIGTVFPLDHRRLHPDVVAAGLHLKMKYDPRPFAIGPAAHAALVHCHEWISAVGPRFFPKQIEKSGEHALNRASGLTAVLPIPQFGHLERPGIHLVYAIAQNYGKAIRAAQVPLQAVVDDVRTASVIAKAASPSTSKVVVALAEGAVQATASLRHRPAAGLGESRGPHYYRRRLAKIQEFKAEDYVDDGVWRSAPGRAPPPVKKKVVKKRARTARAVPAKRGKMRDETSSSSSDVSEVESSDASDSESSTSSESSTASGSNLSSRMSNESGSL